MLDYHVILDLMPTIAGLYSQARLGGEVNLTAVQSAILVAVGQQRKTIEEVEVRHVALSFRGMSALTYSRLSFIFPSLKHSRCLSK